MRKFAFILILVLMYCLSAFAQSGWVMQPGNLDGDLVAVYFTSSDRGWIAGDHGFLASTSDGGRSWAKYSLNTTEDINEIYFRNDDNGYLVAGRKMFVTRDAGRNWQDIRIYRSGEFGTGTPEFLSIFFSDKKRGFVVGSVLKKSGKDEIVVDSLFFRTEDGGDTWQRITLPTKNELFHVFFSSNSDGWIVGDKGLILATTDGGLTWKTQNSGVTRALFNVDFRGGSNGFAVGGGGTILRTTNGGAVWEKVATNFTDTLKRVNFADDKNGWIVGYDGSILRSNDRGKTWIRQESNTRESLYGLFMDKKYGWAVGAKGVILRYKK